ncbi:MAG TPA: TolC family protein [Pyrinomonadaceae bacterium]|nr:TolC family protein [Pyrinomonadaceae bacterium]
MFPRFLLILYIIVAAATGAIAQDPTPSPTPIDTDREGRSAEDLANVPTVAPGFESEERLLPDLGRIGVDMADQRPISVREAIALAFENNTDIEVTRKNVRIAEYDLQAARGVYQPRLVGQTSYERATTPNVSIFSSNQKTTQGAFVGNATVTGYIPRFGTVLSGELTNQRVTTNNPISILSPQYNSGLGLRLVQPLLRGRGFDQNRRTIEIAKRNLSLTDAQFRQRSIEIITSVQRAYWDLTFALRNLQVQRDGVRDAKRQLDHNRRLVEEGQLAPIDIVAAETQVATFEQAVYEALNAVTQAENGLKNLIAPNRHDAIWNESITPTDQVELTVPRTTLGDAITTAMANRPELELNNVQKEINEIDRRYFRNQTLPQVDLIARYSSAGIGGSQNPNFRSPFDIPCDPADPGYEACIARQMAQQAQLQTLLQSIGGAGSSVGDIFANKYPTYSVGIQFNLPLFGDKTAKAQLGRALVEGERIETQREAAEQAIQVDVRNAIQAVRTAEARLRSAAIARENTARQYESEQRKLDEGYSDVYRVLERQMALTAARSNELRAQTELNKAIADLHRATGNALTENDITLLIRGR